MLLRLILLSLLATLAGWVNANDMPMTRFNYQGYAVDVQQKEEDPNLIKIFSDPDLYPVINKLIDVYDPKSEKSFRIHQGTLNDLDKHLEDGYSFDLIATGRLDDAYKLDKTLTSQIQLFAVGRLALWAPGETSRSLNVLKLQTSPIALVNKASAYNSAVYEALKTAELDLVVKSRLTELALFDDVYEKLAKKEYTSGFLPYSHLVEVGLQKRKDVLLINNEHHTSISHGLALTQDGKYSPEAKNFWDFVFSETGNAIIKKAGFE